MKDRRIRVALVMASLVMTTSGMLGLASASAATGPTIASLTLNITGGSLYYPEGIATNNDGSVYVSNTNDNVVGEVSGTNLATIAGSYEGSGESGDGGPATSATLSSPGGLAVDTTGDIFIADTEDNVVREITPNGNIERVAGNGTEGYTGDGGQATQAELDSPQAVAVDSSGDLFIADTYNNVIREVTPNGVISTYAGNGTAGYSGDNGPANQAELTAPSGVAVDSGGNLYIADSGNNVIRRVSTTGTITTVAGNYAADQANGGAGGFSGNGGPATSAQLDSPQGVALDQAGDLFIADTFNNAIREVTPNGTITSLVNTTGARGNTNASTAAASTLSGPYAVAVDNSTGDVYIADTSNNKIKVVSGLPVPGAPASGPVAPGPGSVVPEAPMVIFLPLTALALATGAVGYRRRRQARGVITDRTSNDLRDDTERKERTSVTSELPVLQTPISRRRLLQGGAAAAAAAGLAAYLPASVRQAMALAPKTAFDPAQVQHVVLLMQENRSFDHYFGTLSGIRGFSDPNAMTLGTGRSVFHQPDAANPDGYLLPYHLDSTTSSAQAIPSLSHQWQIQHAAWNHGHMDGWLRAHIAADDDVSGPFTMGYYNSTDIPFQYALANAFTICDNYFCSVLGPTHPNRYMWMTGTVDPNGLNEGPALDNSITNGLYKWPTMAEFLQNAGISWKCYQQLYTTNTAGTQPTTVATLSSLLNNYGTNVLTFMNQFVNAPQNVPFGLYQNACYGSTLFGSPNGTGLAGSSGAVSPVTGAPFDYTQNFEEDCANGTLPAVSWIFPPSTLSEHPSFLPAAGAQFVASKIEALAANEELWNSTVFILNYDENDGLFDHVAPITPPAGTANEFVTLESPGGTPGGGLPIGAGFRVPCIIVSPWTVGGYVCSDAFDHTSILQFVEQIFFSGQATNTNITAWRRSTFGNMTSAFQGNASSPPTDPNFTASATAAELAYQTAQTSGSTKLPLPTFPTENQTVPVQQSGTRPSIG